MTQIEPLYRYKSSLMEYYRRPEYELFDLKVDSEELHNVAEKPAYQVVDNTIINEGFIYFAWE